MLFSVPPDNLRLALNAYIFNGSSASLYYNENYFSPFVSIKPMASSEQQIAELVLKFIGKTISPGELDQLQEYLDESDANRQKFADLTNIDILKKRLREFYNNTGDADATWQRIQDKLGADTKESQSAMPARDRSSLDTES
jgi:hypothetical protein